MKEEHLKRHNDAVGRFNNKKLKCLNCGKDILYKKRRNKFCNHSCAASFNNIGKRRHGEQPNNCLICGKKLLNSNNRCCSIECSNINKYNKNINNWLSGLHPGYKGKTKLLCAFIRKYLHNKYNSKCQKCGWRERHPLTKNVPLQIHHIDGDFKNNKLENLELLCPNCHSLTSNFGSLNKIGNGRRKNNCR